MRVLVTGADGFVGAHATSAFAAAGDEVIRAVGPHGDATGGHPLDVTDEGAFSALLDGAKPDAILHLAGASSVAESHRKPADAARVNTLGVVHLLEATRRSCPAARVVVVSSGEVYGRVADDAPATETTPLSAQSPYASSKAAGELFATQFARSYGLHVVVARPFNHIGAGQAPHFVVPSMASQIARIAAGEAPVLRVGDVTPVRDFSHVRDVVAGYRLLLTRGAAGEAYNVASGVGRTIASLLHALAAIAGVEVRLEVDPARLRPTEIPTLVGDAKKLRALGWTPTRSVEDALAEALADAEQRLASGTSPLPTRLGWVRRAH